MTRATLVSPTPDSIVDDDQNRDAAPSRLAHSRAFRAVLPPSRWCVLGHLGEMLTYRADPVERLSIDRPSAPRRHHRQLGIRCTTARGARTVETVDDELASHTDDLSASRIRTRLVELDDARRALAPDDFAAKHLLNVEVDTLRWSLANTSNAESASTLTNWAGRAGRKGAHTRDDRLEAAKAAIVSPIEGGSAGGSSA